MVMPYLSQVSITWSSRTDLRLVLCIPLRSYAHVLYCHQMGRKHPNPMIPPSWYPAMRAFLRESALPVFCEELLPDAVSQNIFMIVTDIDINCIITICTADFFYPRQIHYFRMLAQIPYIRFITGKTCTVDAALLAGTDADSLPVFYITNRITLCIF